MRKIENLIIHCSASNWGNAEVIDKWHKARGWSGCGYHFIILNGKINSKDNYSKKLDGIIEGGRPIDNDIYIDNFEVGAHAKGLNQNSIGVCLIGNKDFTSRQFDSLTNLIRFYNGMIQDLKIIGHNKINKQKTCPNFDVDLFKKIVSL